MRGILEGRISRPDLDRLAAHLPRAESDGFNLRESLDDEALRGLLFDAARLADEKDVPDEEWEIRIAGELQRVVDEGLGRKGAGSGK
jgi:hypothetical protein